MTTFEDRYNTRWESLFDEAVSLAAERRLADTLTRLKRIRSWQHRQTRYGLENHDWHDAELMWLEGLVLERARRSLKARHVWQRLSVLFERMRRREGEFLPICRRCAERPFGFGPNWYTVARELRELSDGVNIAEALSIRARS